MKFTTEKAVSGCWFTVAFLLRSMTIKSCKTSSSDPTSLGWASDNISGEDSKNKPNSISSGGWESKGEAIARVIFIMTGSPIIELLEPSHVKSSRVESTVKLKIIRFSCLDFSTLILYGMIVYDLKCSTSLCRLLDWVADEVDAMWAQKSVQFFTLALARSFVIWIMQMHV